MESAEFFTSRRPWSERKHRLLQKYLAPFIAKVATTSATREIFVIDGFAGAAKYEDGAKGSPVLIAEYGDVCANWSRPARLRLINIEADPKGEGIFQSLEGATEHWVNTGAVINIHSDFGSAVPEVLRITGIAPALFFIDPFGPTAVRFQELVPILTRRTAVTELIINFDQDGLRRIVDAALSANTDPKAANTNAKNVSSILGGDEWRSVIEGRGLTSEEAEEALLSLYRQKLSSFGFNVVTYPIREELHSKPKYHFVYCTRHPDGLLLMNNFMREEEDALYGEHVEDRLSLFVQEAALPREIEGRRAVLTEIVIDFLKASGTTTREELRSTLIMKDFAVFHEKDYTAVINGLLKQGRVVARSGKNRINDVEPISLRR